MNIKNLNSYIRKAHIKALDKFVADLEAFRQETGDDEPVLYEDPLTSFTLSNVRLDNGQLCYTYDGVDESDSVVLFDEEENDFYEADGVDSITDTIRFWRACLKRAWRYWEMDEETFNAIQNGEIEDEEE